MTAHPDAPTVRFEQFDDVLEALRNPDLSRSFDKRSFAEGNHRAGIVSVIHGQEHRDRRRVENTLFRREMVVDYEQERFPEVVGEILDQFPEDTVLDLLHVAGVLSIPLACRRAGIDHDNDLDTLHRLFDIVLTFAQGSAILDVVVDPQQVRDRVTAALEEFGTGFFDTSKARRLEQLAEGADPRQDLVTLMLHHRDDPRFSFDDAQILREVAIYVQGGSHTSAQTLVNAVDLMRGSEAPEELLAAVVEDRSLAQRVIHETLRLRPTTPEIKRLVEADTEVGGVALTAGTRVVLDVRVANRDRDLFGADAERFDPRRSMEGGTPLWGLSFGGGHHICIGRSTAGGFPVTGEADDEPSPQHLFGLAAQMLSSVAGRNLVPVREGDEVPQLDDQTDRGTRWRRYPVRFRRSPEPWPVG